MEPILVACSLDSEDASASTKSTRLGDSPSSRGSCVRDSETASTASSETPPRVQLPTLKPGGFGGFGPGGSWFWSPSSDAAEGRGALLEPGLLDCLEPWVVSADHSEESPSAQHWEEVSGTTAAQEVATPEGPRLSNVLSVSETDGVCSVHWRIDSKKLSSKDKKAVSPSFRHWGSFRIILSPCAISQERNGACFRRAKGRGFVELKCESREVSDPLVIQASLWTDNGNGETMIKCAEPVRHDFSEKCVCSVSEEWDFSAAVDPASQTFTICLVAFTDRKA